MFLNEEAPSAGSKMNIIITSIKAKGLILLIQGLLDKYAGISIGWQWGVEVELLPAVISASQMDVFIEGKLNAGVSIEAMMPLKYVSWQEAAHLVHFIQLQQQDWCTEPKECHRRLVLTGQLFVIRFLVVERNFKLPYNIFI